MQSYLDIARRLREVRETPLDLVTGDRLDALTQRSLASLLKLSASAVAQYESTRQEGRSRRPPVDVIQAWARVCGYTMILKLVPAQPADTLVEEMEQASPELRRLIRLVLRIGRQLSPEILRKLEQAVFVALSEDSSSQSSPSQGSSLKPPSEDAR